MLEFLTGEKSTPKTEKDAINLLKNDHDKVKKLFQEFEDTKDLRRKKKIAAEAIMELKIHAEIEEKIFYPSVREDIEDDIMYEADEEHHVAKLLIAELDQMDGSEDHWEAKFTVLAENIRHHIKEEEGEMMPKARGLDVDFEAIGRKLLAMKADLKKNGVPPCAEEKLMKRNGKANSPAQNAKRTSAKAVRSVARKAAPTKSGAKSTAKSTRKAASKVTPKKAAAGKSAAKKTSGKMALSNRKISSRGTVKAKAPKSRTAAKTSKPKTKTASRSRSKAS